MRWAIMVLLVATACSFGDDFDPEGKGGDVEQMEPVTVVELAPAEIGGVSDLLVTSATVDSERQADVIPQASGIVRELRVAEGDVVKRGQVLATLENVSLDEGSNRARAELDRLTRDLEATRRLYDQGAASRNDVEQLEFQVKNARSSVREARAGAGNTRLIAPFDGVVASRNVRVGQLAPTGQAALQVVDLDTLRVVASLPERDAGRVKIGQQAELVSAYDSELRSQGTVERIAPIIDAQTGTFRVILKLDANQRSLRPGQYVTVNLVVDRHEGVVVVPKKAVVYEDGAPVLYRLIDAPPPEPDEEGSKDKADKSEGNDTDDATPKAPPSPFVSQRVAVDLGLVDSRYAEIKSGIAAGDQIVVVGQSNLKDGAPIKTPEMVAREQAEAAAKADADTDKAAADAVEDAG